jgi:hypothetical protein
LLQLVLKLFRLETPRPTTVGVDGVVDLGPAQKAGRPLWTFHLKAKYRKF